VLVNQKLIARGEVVVINDKFGVRITDIISPTERVQQLQ
jgi:flagellar motor switch protein FliN/FliY